MDLLRKNCTKLIAASIPFMIVLAIAFAGSTQASNATAPAASDIGGNAMMFDGGSEYVAHCTRCHGSDGRGQTAKGRQTHAGDLTKSRVGDVKGVRMITNGSGQMPSFKSSMNAEQIREVMGYIRGFRQ